MKKLLFLLGFVLCSMGIDAQNVYNSYNSTCGYIYSDGRVCNSSGSTIGRFYGDRIANSSGSTTGYIRGNDIRDSRNSFVGSIRGNYVYNSYNSRVGEIRDDVSGCGSSHGISFVRRSRFAVRYNTKREWCFNQCADQFFGQRSGRNTRSNNQWRDSRKRYCRHHRTRQALCQPARRFMEV